MVGSPGGQGQVLVFERACRLLTAMPFAAENSSLPVGGPRATMPSAALQRRPPEEALAALGNTCERDMRIVEGMD
jgi:hypothetical protein